MDDRPRKCHVHVHPMCLIGSLGIIGSVHFSPDVTLVLLQSQSLSQISAPHETSSVMHIISHKLCIYMYLIIINNYVYLHVVPNKLWRRIIYREIHL